MARSEIRERTDEQPGTASDAQGDHPADELLVGQDSEVDPVLSVVMPTMNEEAGIATCLERAKDAIAELGMTAEILVSDSSTDRTPDIARERGAIVVEPDEEGYGYAYRYAFERVRGDYVAIGDADCTYDFRAIPELLEPVADGEADIVLGSRLEGEIKPGAMPWLHEHVGNPMLTAFLNVFYDADVTDAHSGFRVVDADVLDDLDLEAKGMEFASEMIMHAAVRDVTIDEVPITYHEREGDATLQTFNDGWRHVRFMLVNAPGYLFSVPGLAMLAVGPIMMLATYVEAPIAGWVPGIHSMVSGSLLTIVGFQMLSLGVFATVAGDPLQRPNDSVTTWIAERTHLEYGASLGLVFILAGLAYVVGSLYTWVSTGFEQLPLLRADMLAFTAIVLGIQTLFGSFFMSVLGDTY